MARATAIVSGRRRGQILGYDGRPDWDRLGCARERIFRRPKWQNLIVELRSATSGVGTFSLAKFDHLAELNGKAADSIVQAVGHKRMSAAVH